MTREEAIAYGKECLSWNQFSKDMKMYQFIEMAIRALSQEPTEKPMTTDEMEREYEKSKALFHKIVESDDAIGREDAIKALQKVACYSAAIKARMIGAIEDLPPVTQKSGKWERHYIRPNVYKDLLWYCSSCGKGCGYNNAFMFDFCPNCGIKMESEE